MSSMNSRLKGFGFGKRKSAASIQTADGVPRPSTSSPPPGQIPQQQISLPGQGRTPPIGAPSTQASVAMNRPPSYTSNYPPPPPSGHGDRTSPHQGFNRTPPSQMVGGPPPINTAAPVGYPPPHMAPMGQGPPPMAGPPSGFGGQPGYPPGSRPPQGGPIAQQFQRHNPAAEVEGASKSKSQLIVGIDFGTTFSGVAFAFATNNEAKEDIITEWPGAGSYTKQKVGTN
ncbi:hypothetical protein E4U30_005515 [Claviceps sp. LM220 group G6]|nr:hypothetical protein E4U32_005388 [Claviceps aff. humidiphila group G2b]KAG6088534.1 hypothetical protein E4U31_000157 [Claviceps sp. LM219 group G6]KAG6092353.1 hypothetical protein E4U30_005515 [Claviceps sp. LM220 group G6]